MIAEDNKKAPRQISRVLVLTGKQSINRPVQFLDLFYIGVARVAADADVGQCRLGQRRDVGLFHVQFAQGRRDTDVFTQQFHRIDSGFARIGDGGGQGERPRRGRVGSIQTGEEHA